MTKTMGLAALALSGIALAGCGTTQGTNAQPTGSASADSAQNAAPDTTAATPEPVTEGSVLKGETFVTYPDGLTVRFMSAFKTPASTIKRLGTDSYGNHMNDVKPTDTFVTVRLRYENTSAVPLTLQGGYAFTGQYGASRFPSTPGTVLDGQANTVAKYSMPVDPTRVAAHSTVQVWGTVAIPTKSVNTTSVLVSGSNVEATDNTTYRADFTFTDLSL